MIVVLNNPRLLFANSEYRKFGYENNSYNEIPVIHHFRWAKCRRLMAAATCSGGSSGFVCYVDINVLQKGFRSKYLVIVKMKNEISFFTLAVAWTWKATCCKRKTRFMGRSVKEYFSILCWQVSEMTCIDRLTVFLTDCLTDCCRPLTSHRPTHRNKRLNGQPTDRVPASRLAVHVRLINPTPLMDFVLNKCRPPTA